MATLEQPGRGPLNVHEFALDDILEPDGDDSVAHGATGGTIDEAAALLAEAAEQAALDPDDDDQTLGLNVERLRLRVVRAAMLGYTHRANIGYTQRAQRWDGITNRCRSHRGQYPRRADCSSYVTWCLWDALGGPNAGPDVANGTSWACGYTGTLKQHGRRITLQDDLPGDLVHYGPGTGAHVTIVVGKNRVVSHGQTSGPQLYAPDYRSIAEV